MHHRSHDNDGDKTGENCRNNTVLALRLWLAQREQNAFNERLALRVSRNGTLPVAFEEQDHSGFFEREAVEFAGVCSVRRLESPCCASAVDHYLSTFAAADVWRRRPLQALPKDLIHFVVACLRRVEREHVGHDPHSDETAAIRSGDITDAVCLHARPDLPRRWVAKRQMYASFSRALVRRIGRVQRLRNHGGDKCGDHAFHGRSGATNCQQLRG